MKHFKQFEVTASPLNIDLISGLLWELDITGINEEDDKIILFADAESEINKSIVEEQLNKLKLNNIVETFGVREFSLEDKNWNEEWEKSINVIEISDRIVIKPSFRKFTPNKNQLVLEIDPKMSFGTGEHQTTKLVVLLLDKYVKAGQKVFDVGSGTGILAIAAVTLGADKALAIDNDEWCYENGIENAEANNCSDKVEVRLAEIENVTETNFDLITANINKHILLNIAERLSSKLAPGGILILSGILMEDEADIWDSYKNFNLELIDRENLDEWLALVLKKVG
jgi:ribosomal protein L11 methyltransferase